MNTSLFEDFLVLSETLSFTKAAEKLYKSQSVLSRQISKLETIMGCKLFIRTNKSVSLTLAGSTLRKGLLQLSQEYDALIREVRAKSEGRSGTIVIALTPGVRFHNNMYKIIFNFINDYPDINVDLRIYDIDILREQLSSQKVDFAYGVVDDYYGVPDSSYEIIGYSQNFIVVPRSHPHAARTAEELSLIDFKDDTFLFFECQSRAIREMSRKCKNAGFNLQYTTVPDSSKMALMLELHKGILITDEMSMFRFSGDSVYIPLPDLGSLRLGVVWNNKSSNACSRTFIEYLRQERKASIS